VVRGITKGIFTKKFNFISEQVDIKPPFIVLCNHTIDYDALLIATAFKEPIHFVMSDHVSSIPVAGKLIKHLVAPIPITKSTIDAATVKKMFNKFKLAIINFYTIHIKYIFYIISNVLYNSKYQGEKKDMDASLPNNILLSVMFKRLRKEEGLESSKLMSTLEPNIIYSILLNARYKQDKSEALTALEETLRKEAGNYIAMYINEKWQQIKSGKNEELPFPEFATKTIADVLTKSKMNA
jgi:hypothetical protein